MSEQQIILPIRTKKELMDFARASNQLHNDQHRNLVVTLTEDINLGGKEWTPIGNENFPFHGTFDGGGHIIRGLHISQNREGCYGLFGAIDGTVKNLTILGTMNCLADDLYSAVGGIAGMVVGGHIQDCTANLTIESNGKNIGLFSGGIAGRVENGTIQNCHSSVVFQNIGGNFLYLGGVVGSAANSQIDSCVFDGTIHILDGADEKFSLGGIAGSLEGQSDVICCTHNGIAEGQWRDTDFPAVGEEQCREKHPFFALAALGFAYSALLYGITAQKRKTDTKE